MLKFNKVKVCLKNDSTILLIIGRQLYSKSNHIIRDYATLEYPNGFVSSNEMFILFDNKDIGIAYHYGYVDEQKMGLDNLIYEASYKGGEKK